MGELAFLAALPLDRQVGHDRSVQQKFQRFAGDAQAWVGEVPNWARLTSVGIVNTYWRWRDGEAPPSGSMSIAAWGLRVGLGGRGLYGVLGARFEPHDYPFLRVAVSATSQEGDGAPAPFDKASVCLPHEYVGGVLAGAVQEADLVGPGTVTFEWAAVHPVDSDWELFRLLAVGVMRLLAESPRNTVPSDLLPYFGGTSPDAPGRQ